MISQEEAIEIAKKEALTQGWGWIEPIDVRWRYDGWFAKRGKWEIHTNVHARGGNIRMIISDEGEVIEKGFLSR